MLITGRISRATAVCQRRMTERKSLPEAVKIVGGRDERFASSRASNDWLAAEMREY